MIHHRIQFIYDTNQNYYNWHEQNYNFVHWKVFITKSTIQGQHITCRLLVGLKKYLVKVHLYTRFIFGIQRYIFRCFFYYLFVIIIEMSGKFIFIPLSLKIRRKQHKEKSSKARVKISILWAVTTVLPTQQQLLPAPAASVSIIATPHYIFGHQPN